MTEDYQPKETRGQRKIEQYLKDLKRNKQFLRDFNQYRKIIDKDLNRPEVSKIMTPLIEKYFDLIKLIKRVRKKYPDNTKQFFDYLAEKYGLDEDLVSVFVHSNLLQENDIETGYYQDMCALYDSYDENLNPIFGEPFPIQLDSKKQQHIRAYPIRIDIHKFASKRDVLDFIEKRWEIIESYLETYRGEKKKRFRQRKHDRKMIDYIWNNRLLKSKEIKKGLDKNFPQNTLAYFEINKIIKLEEKRRQGNLV